VDKPTAPQTNELSDDKIISTPHDIPLTSSQRLQNHLNNDLALDSDNIPGNPSKRLKRY